MSDDRPDAATPATEPGDAQPAVDVQQVPTGAHPVLVYTLKRIALLVLVGAVLYLVGLRDIWLILFAFLISGVVSAVVLSRSREGAAYGITSAITRVNARIDESARAEDYDDLDDVAPADDPDGSTDDRPA